MRLRKTRPLPSVIGLVAGLPLNVAADARPLRGIHRPASQHTVDGTAKVLARHRNGSARPAVIELPAIDQAPLLVEKEKVRRTRSLVGLGGLLALVIAVRKFEAKFSGV